MISFAAMKDSGAMNPAAGILYGRSRSGSALRSAASVSGANPYMITVADVTSETSDCQLGNGRNAMMPTTKATTVDTQGMPRFEIFDRPLGAKPDWPRA